MGHTHNTKLVLYFVTMIGLCTNVAYTEKLVEIKDYLWMSSEDFTETFYERLEGFENYQYFEQHNTVYGYPCYLTQSRIDVNFVENACISKQPHKRWTLILPFDDSYFVSNLNLIDEYLLPVETVIFTYSGSKEVTNPAPRNNRPYVISFCKREIMEKRGIEQKSYPNPSVSSYTINHSHEFHQNCHLMNATYPFYILAIVFLAFCSVFYLVFTCYVRRRSSNILQKALSFVPLYLLAYTITDFAFYKSCPWLSNHWITYLQLFQTVMYLLATPLLFGLICLANMGDSILRTEFSKREKCWTLSITLGFFVINLLNYIFANLTPVKNIILCLIYGCFLYAFVIIFLKKLTTIQRIAVAEGNRDRMVQFVRKQFFIQGFTSTLLSYVIFKIVSNNFHSYIQEDIQIWWFIVIYLFMGLFAIALLFFLLRLKQSPDSLLLNIHNDQNDQQNEQNEVSEELKDNEENKNNDDHDLVPIGRVVPASEISPEAMPFLHQTEMNQNRYESSNLDPQTFFRQGLEYQDAYRNSQIPHSDNDDGNIYPSINAPTYND